MLFRSPLNLIETTHSIYRSVRICKQIPNLKSPFNSVNNSQSYDSNTPREQSMGGIKPLYSPILFISSPFIPILCTSACIYCRRLQPKNRSDTIPFATPRALRFFKITLSIWLIVRQPVTLGGRCFADIGFRIFRNFPDTLREFW